MPELEFGTLKDAEMNEADNRRAASRLPFIGLRLKVRRRGFPRAAKFQECYSIDLSNSGLAFTSSSLKLTELEKVDFVLRFQTQTIQGIAQVRYVRPHAEYVQYGLMFLQSLHELDTFLVGENLTTQEIKQLAGALAENVAYGIQEERDKKLRAVRQRQRFCDALNAYFKRLSEMGIKLPAVYSKTPCRKHARDAVEIDEANGHIVFVRYSIEHDDLIPERIQLMQKGNDATLYYQTGSGEIFHNLFETLSYLSDEISLVAKLSHFFPHTGRDNGKES